tara:strand:- start:1323 stop:2120 length:798 start_codon:yes stop_codon:yes gene_type:complete
MIKVLELFSGTGSVGKCCKKLDWDVVSVDLLLPADHEVDILEFDYKQYPKNEFDIVWASPPCTYYSNLQNCWLGRKKKDGIVVTRDVLEQRRRESDKLIEKTLEIIDYFQPELWFMENPATGCLRNRDVVKGLDFYDVSYCMYSDWGYEKKTRIWTNKKDWDNLICDRSGKCGNMIEIKTDGAVHSGYKTPIKSDTRKIHTNVIGDGNKLKAVRKHKLNVSKDVHTVGEKKGKHKKDVSKDYGSGTNRLDRYRVPEDLIFSLFLD